MLFQDTKYQEMFIMSYVDRRYGVVVRVPVLWVGDRGLILAVTDQSLLNW